MGKKIGPITTCQSYLGPGGILRGFVQDRGEFTSSLTYLLIRGQYDVKLTQLLDDTLGGAVELAPCVVAHVYTASTLLGVGNQLSVRDVSQSDFAFSDNSVEGVLTVPIDLRATLVRPRESFVDPSCGSH